MSAGAGSSLCNCRKRTTNGKPAVPVYDLPPKLGPSTWRCCSQRFCSWTALLPSRSQCANCDLQSAAGEPPMAGDAHAVELWYPRDS
eukprot:7377488-Pyramimonas_sp.AAC.1